MVTFAECTFSTKYRCFETLPALNEISETIPAFLIESLLLFILRKTRLAWRILSTSLEESETFIRMNCKYK